MNQKRIIYQNSNGVLSVIVPAIDCGLTVQEIAKKDVPEGVAFSIIDASELPADRLFRGAWKIDGGCVVENLDKAKDIAHNARRASRAEEFKPLDVQVTIPALAVQAEAARQVIRDKYAVIQSDIDAAASVEALKSAAAEVL